jgi:hypothetical protein
MRKELALNILKELNLIVTNQSGDNDSFSIEFSNKNNDPIGKLSYTNNVLFFYTFDPTYNYYTIEGGQCSLNRESVESIIREFSYNSIN